MVKKNGRTWMEKVKRRCNKVLVGKINEVWEEACELEEKGKNLKSKNWRRKSGIELSNPLANEIARMCKKSQSKISGTDKSQESLKKRKLKRKKLVMKWRPTIS